MRPKPIDVLSVLAGAVALAYPFLVWFGVDSLPAGVFVLLGIASIGLRLYRRRLSKSWIEIAAFASAGTALAVLAMLSPTIASRAYPVAIALAVASVFAASLIFPPTMVERIARLTEPNLSPQGVAYTASVTRMWVVFLLLNAAISLWTAIWGSLEQWVLWNGLLSYLAMGALFAGEFLVRRMVRA
jgi:uncharacterized membrane protein